MSALPYETEQEGWDGPEEDQVTFPSRPRRQFLTRGSMALLAIVLCAAGFYAGVRVEKGQLANSPSTTTSAAGARGGFAARFGGAGAGAGAGTGTGSSSSASGRGGAGGFAAAASGNASFGTVSAIDGKTLYLTQVATGNVIKVNLSGATKITKNVSVGRSAIRPGDTVVVQGLKESNGTITATSVSDTGASTGVGAGAGLGGLFGGRGGGSGASGAGGSGASGAGGSASGASGAGGSGGGGSGGGGSAINQLFGGGSAGR